MGIACRILASIAIAIVIALAAYVAWYSYNRKAVIARSESCQYQTAHPETAPKMRAPDGTMVPVMTPCLIEVVPPPFLDLVRGRMTFTGVPNRMKIYPYSLIDVLLERYTLGPDILLPCDQTATTTDCTKLTQ
jgi:hypothetical protein